jgi:hypothetical protein
VSKLPCFQGVHFVADNGMTSANGGRSWRRAALAGVLGVTVAIGCAGTSARAAEDEDELPDAKIFRHILQGLGLRHDQSGIDYRERPPLVLPANRTQLPPPEPESRRVATWPDDPDLKRARQIKAQQRKRQSHVDGVDDRPLLPSQYSSPAPPPGRDDGQPRKSADESSLPSTLKELGSKSLFSWNSLWGSRNEYETFAGEPPRSTLTEPPAGYRTPSPNQPYGVGPEKWTPKPTDRHEQAK